MDEIENYINYIDEIIKKSTDKMLKDKGHITKIQREEVIEILKVKMLENKLNNIERILERIKPKEEKRIRKFEFTERILKNMCSNLNSEGYSLPKLPERSTAKSAGYDFFVQEDTVCKAHEITLVKTGIKAQFPDDEVLLLFNRSSNPKKKGLIIPNGVGVIDADYYNNPDNEGEIGGLFYNMLDEDITLKAGEKMMQGIFVKYGITDDDNATGTRNGGFGSTGR